MAFLSFPPPSHWDSEGFVTVGGPLTPGRLVEAYRQGIFPWPIDATDAGLIWWSPNPRAVLFPGDLHVPRRLARTLRKAPFRITTDIAFAAVMDACGSVGDRKDATWITPAIQAAYLTLHQDGIAHSMEAWQGEQLVGGLYGICLGSMFAGESMFSLVRDASKVVFVTLVQMLAAQGCTLFDVQMATDHLQQFGIVEMPRSTYRRLLAESLTHPACWPQPVPGVPGQGAAASPAKSLPGG
ncbi:MAG: leucyl/phenylalanyl-tRNA--protein transferase [Pirellulales bacterium]|jgi:leucyl/phenylalanyl-tRNA--protein transferase